MLSSIPLCWSRWQGARDVTCHSGGHKRCQENSTTTKYNEKVLVDRPSLGEAFSSAEQMPADHQASPDIFSVGQRDRYINFRIPVAISARRKETLAGSPPLARAKRRAAWEIDRLLPPTHRSVCACSQVQRHHPNTKSLLFKARLCGRRGAMHTRMLCCA